MDLVRWYPNLGWKYEQELHDRFNEYAIKGEWYNETGFEQISKHLDSQYTSEHDKCDLQEALMRYSKPIKNKYRKKGK